MTFEEVQEIVIKNTRSVLPDLDGQEIPIEASLKDLGANSMDRADIVVQCLEDLRLETPLVEFRVASNIRGLIDLLYQKVRERPAASAVR
jgi:polyketide biosynthesis acyl carrier protein